MKQQPKQAKEKSVVQPRQGAEPGQSKVISAACTPEIGKRQFAPFAALAPVPSVLVTSHDADKDNVFTVGWTGTVCSKPPMLSISVREQRHSYAMIQNSKEFVVNLTTGTLARAADICGVKSGKDVDKFKLCRLTKEPAKTVNAPLIAQSPVNLECRVVQEIALGSHTMFLAEITAVHVSESMIDKTGKLRFEKAGLLAYAHGMYFELGRSVGTFGYAVRKKKKK